MIQIFLDPNYPSGEPVKAPAAERVRALADYLAALLGPDAVRRADNQPPYPKESEDELHYQLDQGNDWFLNAELKKPDGTVLVSVTHRYHSTEKLEALRGMIRAFTRYRLAAS